MCRVHSPVFSPFIATTTTGTEQAVVAVVAIFFSTLYFVWRCFDLANSLLGRMYDYQGVPTTEQGNKKTDNISVIGLLPFLYICLLRYIMRHIVYSDEQADIFNCQCSIPYRMYTVYSYVTLLSSFSFSFLASTS